MSEELGESIKHTLKFLSTNLLPVYTTWKIIRLYQKGEYQFAKEKEMPIFHAL